MAANYKLSEGSLEAIMNGSTLVDPIVQVLGNRKMVSGSNDSERYRLSISDGKYRVNYAMITVKNYHDSVSQALEVHSIIKLKRYLTNVIKNKEKDMRVILILDLELVSRGCFVGRPIGDPVSLPNCDSSSSQLSSSSLIAFSPLRRRVTTANLAEGRVMSPIASLNPFHNNWVIKARITNKSNIRNWTNARGEGKLFTIDLVDQSGEIRCTAFNELVDKFFEMLEVDKVYYFSKCLLQPANPQFCSFKHHFEMTFVSETQVEESLNDNDAVPQTQYDFVTLDKVATMENGTIIDIIAVCKAVSDLQIFTSKASNRELKKKDVLLVDQSKIGISLTLWGADAETFNVTTTSVILVKGAKISEFQGAKNVVLVTGSCHKLNPNLPQTSALLSWYDLEGKNLEFRNVSARSTLLGQVPWMTFKEVQQLSHEQAAKGIFFQTFATVLIVRLDRAVYKACPTENCQKKVMDLENRMYSCEKCNREFPNFKYRLLVSMNVSDASSNQWVTVFSSKAEKILGKAAQEVGEALETDQDYVAKLFEEVQFKQYTLKCKAQLETYNDEQKLRVVVLGANGVNFEEHNDCLMKRIEKLRQVE